MITQKHIKNACYTKKLVKHVLAPSGLAKEGKISIEGEEVIIYLDSETNELVAHQLVKPRVDDPNYSPFEEPFIIKN